MFSDNSSKASEFFKSKQEYENIYPVVQPNKIYDIWYEMPYYGKTDANGVVVYPKEEALKNLDTRGEFKAINFVADAFFALQTFIQTSKSKKVFSSDFFGRFSAKRAWVPLPLLYDDYHTNFIFDPFLNNFLAGKKITSFNCFVKEYLNFVRFLQADVSFTLNEFILSNHCTNKISGLIIDLATDDHSDTNKKVTDYLAQSQYLYFIDMCRTYGFRVNKNAPWQLIADLSTKSMVKYASKYGISLNDNNLFENYYYKATVIDYFNFKSYMWGMYSDYYALNTTYSKLDVKFNFIKNSSPMFSQYETVVINELPVENPGDKNEFLEQYNDIFFLRLYLKVRLIENNIEEKFNEYEKYLIDYFHVQPLSKIPNPMSIWRVRLALRYIDKKLINSNLYKTEELNPHYFNT